MRVSCMKPFCVVRCCCCFFSFTFFNRSPSASVVWENAATLFCCEAPEMVWERWIFIRLSVSMKVNRCDNIWIFWVSCTFKIPVQSKAPSLIWMEVVFHRVTFSIHSYFWLSPPTTPSITDDRVETRYLLTLTACYWFNAAGLIFHCVSVDMISALFSTREQLPKEFFLPLRLCISPQQVNWERTVVEEGRRGRDMGIKKINSLTFCFCQFPVVAPLLSLLFPSFALSPVSDESFLEG